MKLTSYGEPIFKTGDRIELWAPVQDLRHAQLPLDPALNGFLTRPNLSVVVETAGGAFSVEHDWMQGVLKSPALTEFANKAGALNLECSGMEPWSFRLKFEPSEDVGAAGASLTTEQGAALTFAPEDAALLKNDRLSLARLRDFRLSLQAARLGMVASFEQLLSLPWPREVDLLEHQLGTARTVLRRLRGSALLDQLLQEAQARGRVSLAYLDDMHLTPWCRAR